MHDFWTSSIERIEASLAPENAGYFTSVDVMQFDDGVNFIDSFCLPEGQEFEFFLNLETISLNGKDLEAVGLSTSPSIADALVIDKKSNVWQGDNYSFHLYYKGETKPGQTELYIVYQA